MPEISEEELAEFQRLKESDAVANMYGSPATGGGTPPGRGPTDDERWIGDFQQRFDDPSATVSVHEISKYARLLGGAHLAVRMAEVSQAFQRAGISPTMIRDHLEGKTRQRRPAGSGVSRPPRG